MITLLDASVKQVNDHKFIAQVSGDKDYNREAKTWEGALLQLAAILADQSRLIEMLAKDSQARRTIQWQGESLENWANRVFELYAEDLMPEQESYMNLGGHIVD